MDERKAEVRKKQLVAATWARAHIPHDTIHRIAVFRALRLGDMLCAIPALRALRKHWPAAEITWIGLPELGALAPRFPQYIDQFVAFPGYPDLPERSCRRAEFLRFAHRWQRHFDLAVQMHGDGRISNGIVAALKARYLLGFSPDPVASPRDGVFVPYPEGHEIERLLHLVAAVYPGPSDTALEFPLLAADHREVAALEQSCALRPRGYVCVHPGASVPSRQWPPARFAEVARALRQTGLEIVVTGSDADRDATRTLFAELGSGAVDLTGRTSLGALALLLKRAALVITNDTAVSHLASAVGARSLTIVSASDPARWAPLSRDRNRSVWGAAPPCRPCPHWVCPTQHECAVSVPVQRVLEATRDWIQDRPHVA